MRPDDVTLLDIAKAARLIQIFIGGMTREEFLDDPKTQSEEVWTTITSDVPGLLAKIEPSLPKKPEG